MATARITQRALAALLAAAVAAIAVTACGPRASAPPAIAFAPYGTGYEAKPDFNDVEYRFPLSADDRRRITPANLAELDQEQIDQIYARLTAGPIPDGPFDGAIVLPRGASGKLRLAEIAGGLDGMALEIKGLALEDVAQTLWKGKVFDREHRALRNRIEHVELLRKLGLVDADAKPQTVDGKPTWLLFPAKLYCGQSLLDARRESIVIDYAFADDLPGYREKPDFLAGRRGLRVRDEIRMVRPGFYLGRAYIDRVFALNFTLYDATIADEPSRAGQLDNASEACWVGTQAHRVASAP